MQRLALLVVQRGGPRRSLRWCAARRTRPV